MIVRSDKTYEVNSLFPDLDWYGEGNYVVDETKAENQELIQKIKDNAPYMDLVIEDGEIVDIIPRPDLMPEPEPEHPKPPSLEDRISALEDVLLLLLMEV